MTALPRAVAGPSLRPCPVCGAPSCDRFLAFPSVPVFCNVLLPDRESAVAAPRAEISLAVCRNCSHVYNDAFEASLVAYSPRYENALHHSGVFRDYSAELIERLVNQHGLRGKRVLEIGCGQGDFLSELCLAGGNSGLGYDPSFAGGPPPAGVERIEPRYFGPDDMDDLPDAVICRQVLEHIEEPAAFLTALRAAIGDREVFVFFEVPNGLWPFGGGGIWDVIYEHCGYFTANSLEAAFRRTGFEPLDVRETFAGQFLTIVARPSCEQRLTFPVAGAALADEIVESAEQLLAGTQQWNHELARLGEEAGPVVIWGTGSKGVTFLNLCDPGGTVGFAVDLNPRKHGMFVPGAAQQVVSPEDLATIRPRTVIVMNPNYSTEVAAKLDALGVRADLLAASPGSNG